MKIRLITKNRCKAQVLAEACIGLSLVTFAWIVITHSLFMANNHIRTEMAARHAAWYKGTTGHNLTQEQLDTFFFYQTNVAAVSYGNGQSGGTLLGLSIPGLSQLDEEGFPTKATVTFGPRGPAQAAQFPFNLLNTQVPFMPDSMLSNSVSASCQWDHVGEPWTDPKKVLSALWRSLTGVLGSFVPGL